MTKKKDNSWVQNIQYIFTEEELNNLVDNKKLDKITVNMSTHYFKAGCKKDFLKYLEEQEK